MIIQRQEFVDQGFVIVRNFLDSAELTTLSTYLDNYIRVVSTLPGRPEHKGGTAFRLEPTMPLISKWDSLASELLGAPVQRSQGTWVNKTPYIGERTTPHQDFRTMFCESVTIWMALDPVDAENGCLSYIPGSHRELRKHVQNEPGTGTVQVCISDFSEADERAGVPAHLQPGDAVAHHGNCVHWAGPNRSPRNRRAVTMVYFVVMLVAATANAGPPIIRPGPSSAPASPSGNCVGAYERTQNAIVARSMARQRAIEQNAARAVQCRPPCYRSVFVSRRW